MINSRDSYTDFNPNKKEIIEVPYCIGTIIELKDNPDVLAKICQYRIGINQEIRVGLSKALNILENNSSVEKPQSLFTIPQKFIATDFSDSVDFEITTQELEGKWRKTDRIIIGKLDQHKFNGIIGLSEYYKKSKKLQLKRVKK